MESTLGIRKLLCFYFLMHFSQNMQKSPLTEQNVRTLRANTSKAIASNIKDHDSVNKRNSHEI